MKYFNKTMKKLAVLAFFIVAFVFVLQKQIVVAQTDKTKQEYVQKFLEIQKAAEAGDAKAQFELGEMYYAGIIIEDKSKFPYFWRKLGGDQDKAIEWWEKSAKQGYEKAITKINNLVCLRVFKKHNK